MDPLIRATLVLTTDQYVEPRVVSERTGLTMTEGRALGEIVTMPNGFVRPPSKRSWWAHMPDGFERTFDLEAVLIRLLDHLDPVEPALAAVRTQYGFDAHVTVNIQLDEEVTPNGTLRATTLARLDIDLDLDLYTTQGV